MLPLRTRRLVGAEGGTPSVSVVPGTPADSAERFTFTSKACTWTVVVTPGFSP